MNKEGYNIILLDPVYTTQVKGKNNGKKGKKRFIPVKGKNGLFLRRPTFF